MDCYEIIITSDVALDYIRAIRSEIQKLTYMASSIAPIKHEPWHPKGVRKVSAKNFYIYYSLLSVALFPKERFLYCQNGWFRYFCQILHLSEMYISICIKRPGL